MKVRKIQMLKQQEQLNIERKKKLQEKKERYEKVKHDPSIVAIDTNVFISLAAVDAYYEPKDRSKAGFLQTVRDMKRLAITGNLKFIITPTVLYEINKKLSDEEKKFLDEYCYIFIPKHPEDYSLAVTNLSKQYIQRGVMRADKNHVPERDAEIMAEATVLGVNLITNNFTDFKNYDKEEHKKSGARSTDIETVNERLDYAIDVNNMKIIPRPYTSYEYLINFRSQVFSVPDEIKNKIKEIDEKNFQGIKEFS